MAVTKIHSINETMNAALDYIMNPMKTDDGFLVDGFHCTPEVAAEQYELTRRKFHKPGGKLGFHIIQSVAPGEVLRHRAPHRNRACGQDVRRKVPVCLCDAH